MTTNLPTCSCGNTLTTNAHGARYCLTCDRGPLGGAK